MKRGISVRAGGSTYHINSQLELSGELRWKRDLRNSTVFSASRESCLLPRPAFAAAEAEIASAHARERINFSRARVRATYTRSSVGSRIFMTESPRFCD